MSNNNGNSTATSSAVDKRTVPKKDRSKSRSAAKSGKAISSASREAKQRAAAILEVLAGGRTPTDAAEALGVSLQRYYLLEQRALEGLLSACESRARGRVQSPKSRMAELQREVERLGRECARQQALVRASQRTVGLAAVPPAPKATRTKRKRRKRRPTVRALKAAAALRTDAESETSALSTGNGPAS